MDTDALRRKPRPVPRLPPARFLTVHCYRQTPYFSTIWARATAANAIVLACDTHDVTLCAWVIMPEHVHLLILPRSEPDPVPPFVAAFKKLTSHWTAEVASRCAPAYRRHMTHTDSTGRTTRRFWRPGASTDIPIRMDESFYAAILRIHRNPVRRGLADRPEEWDWSSARHPLEPRFALLQCASLAS